jgi:hypothetical protein
MEVRLRTKPYLNFLPIEFLRSEERGQLTRTSRIWPGHFRARFELRKFLEKIFLVNIAYLQAEFGGRSIRLNKERSDRYIGDRVSGICNISHACI